MCAFEWQIGAFLFNTTFWICLAVYHCYLRIYTKHLMPYRASGISKKRTKVQAVLCSVPLSSCCLATERSDAFLPYGFTHLVFRNRPQSPGGLGWYSCKPQEQDQSSALILGNVFPLPPERPAACWAPGAGSRLKQPREPVTQSHYGTLRTAPLHLHYSAVLV